MNGKKKIINKLDKDYLSLISEIIKEGNEKNDRTGTGTLSIFGKLIEHDMSDGFPLLTSKKVYWKKVISELIWFLRGNTNIKWMLENNNFIWSGDALKNYETLTGDMENSPISKREMFANKILGNEEFANKWGDMGPIYPKQWTAWNKYKYNDVTKKYEIYHINQIQNCIDLLISNPDSRRIIVSAWNVAEMDEMILPPCHDSFQFYTRKLSFGERCRNFNYIPYLIEDKNESDSCINQLQFEKFHHNEMDKLNIPGREISLSWRQRSCDVPLGLPFNIASYGLLLEIISNIVNMVPGKLKGFLGDTHIYKNQIKPIKKQLKIKEFYTLPKLEINNISWDKIKTINDFISAINPNDIKIKNYKSHPGINIPLSN